MGRPTRERVKTLALSVMEFQMSSKMSVSGDAESGGGEEEDAGSG
jgi:hypothetical protein